MTDSTGKNASMNADDCPWTDEEIDKIKFDRKSGEDPFKVLDILVKSKCK